MSVVKDLLRRLFWDGAETPSAAALAGKIEELRAELGHAEEMRAFYAAERQRLLAVMSRDELRDADRLAADAQNDVDRLRAQIAALEAAHADAVEREKHAELDRRVADAKRRVKEAGGRLDEYERLARQVADIVDELLTLDAEIDRLNHDLHAADRWPESVASVAATYRKAPDHVTAEVREMRKVWVRRNPETEQEEDSAVFGFDPVSGERYPTVAGYGQNMRDAGAYQVTREVVVQAERVRPGAWLPGLSEVCLPPAKAGRPGIYPRG